MPAKSRSNATRIVLAAAVLAAVLLPLGLVSWLISEAPAEVGSEASRMLVAGANVAAVALPFGVSAWLLARRRREPLLPAWQPWRVPWGGFEVAGVAFLILSAAVPGVLLLALSQVGFYREVYGPHFPGVPATRPPTVEASAALAGMPAATAAHDDLAAAGLLRELWARTFALPVLLGLLYLAARSLFPTWRPRPRSGLAGSVALAVAAWAVLTPLVLGFNLLVNLVFTLFDVPPETHALTRFAGRTAFDPVLFLAQVAVAAPLTEELLFRGVLLPWLLASRRPKVSPELPPAWRPWVAVGAAVLFAALSGDVAPVVFAAVMAAGLVVALAVFRSKRRTVGAVYGSAAFFAAVHSSVWPSPIPLFVLGLGLGWLAVRTRGILVPAIVHGLFNAVSGVFVLRGGMM